MSLQLRVGIVVSTRVDIGGGSTYETAVLERIEKLDTPHTVFFIIKKIEGGYFAQSDSNRDTKEASLARKTRRNLFSGRHNSKTPSLAVAIQHLNLDLLYFASPVQEMANHAGLPYIATVWDLGITQLSHFPEFSSAYGDKMLDVLRRALPRAYRVIVDSKATRDSLVHKFGLDSTKIITAGLPLLMEQPRIRPELDLPERYVIYPAKFWAHKNHSTLLSAFVDVVEKIPDAHLVLTGIEATDQDSLRKLIAEFRLEDSVLIFPQIPRPELSWIIKSSKALLMPSLLGPTNYPPIEATSIGVRALISDVHRFDFDLPETMTVIPSRDPKSWSEAIIASILDDSEAQVFVPEDHFSEEFLTALESFRCDLELWKHPIE